MSACHVVSKNISYALESPDTNGIDPENEYNVFSLTNAHARERICLHNHMPSSRCIISVDSHIFGALLDSGAEITK